MNLKPFTCPAIGAVAAAVTLALTACTGSPAAGLDASTGNSPAPGSSAANPDSGDCLLGANGADVEAGIANPTVSCSKWIQNLAGLGLVWYPISQMALPGSPGSADQETMQQACDLTDGTEELYVEDAGGQAYGDSICSQEEQNGWTPEGSPGPLAGQAQQAARQQAQQQASASAAAQAQQSQATQQGQAEADKQQAENEAADATAKTACASFGGDWNDPGSSSFTASNGLVFSITSGPPKASCDNVPYLGTDDSTYLISIQFSSDGTPQYIGPAASLTGATQSECTRGYYPDQSAGQTTQPPGTWSSVLGLCLPPKS